MNRKAIIIGNNTGKDAPTYLQGVTYDLQNYKKYLISKGGGSWLDVFEISILENQGKSRIIQEIKQCSADYAFIVFTGHGFLNSKDNQTYVCVDGDYISESELRTSASKQSLILDCCRQKSSINESVSSYRNFSGGINYVTLSKNLSSRILQGRARLYNEETIKRGLESSFKSERIINNARSKFDSAIVSSSLGLFTGYACQIDQTSSDNPTSGGAYSTALMKAGKDFSATNSSVYSLPINEAHTKTSIILSNDPLTNQRPDYKLLPSSMQLTAPFAITNTFNE